MIGTWLRDERGAVLPMAMALSLVLTSLTLAFLTLSANEPQIAANLISGDQALSLAEAGIEDAIWALNNGGTSGIVYPGTLPARYNNALPHTLNGTRVALGTGVYTVTIQPAGTNATITATGWLLDDTGAMRAKRAITVVVMSFTPPNNNPPAPFLDPPGALTGKGEVQATGNTNIDSRGSSCGTKVGIYTKDATRISGSADIYGGDGNNSPDQEGGDFRQNQAPETFSPVTLTQDQINLLKSIAKSNGTYYGPGYPPTGSTSYTGSVNFASSNPLPSGVVFVDTISGNPIGSPPNAGDLATVDVSGNATSGGWLIVMGSIRMTGTVTYNGLVYAANDFVGLGNLTINGAVLSLNAVDAVASSVDSTASGASNISYDCDAIRKGATGPNPPKVPQGFLIKPGTWRELSG